MVESNQNNLTEDEADLYDRQIRLWGLDSQKRLRASTVLVIGVHGLGAEFCKNIVLAGIKSITLLDDKDSNSEDAWCQFLIPRDKIGSNRAEASSERVRNLNPMVEVSVDKESIDKKPDEFFTQFNVVVVTDCDLQQLLRINEICHKANVKFYSAGVFGFYGYLFADLQCQEYMDEKVVMRRIPETSGSKRQKTENIGMHKISVKEKIEYPTLRQSLVVTKQLTDRPARVMADLILYFLLRVLFKFRTQAGRNPQGKTRVEDLETLKKLRDSELQEIGLSADKVPDEYLDLVFSQVSPVCAIIGGELAQEVIKTLSQKGEPHNNFFFFNPITNTGTVIKIGE